MRQGKQIHQGYSFFWGVFLLLVMSAAISIHAEAPSTKELVLFKDTLKNDTIVPQSPKKNGTFVIRDRIPIPSDEPLFIVNGMELPYEIFAALNPAHIESLEVLKDASATAIYGTRGINGVNRRNARYYISGKEVPASTAYQTSIEQMEVKTGADGILEIYIKPMIFLRGEYE